MPILTIQEARLTINIQDPDMLLRHLTVHNHYVNNYELLIYVILYEQSIDIQVIYHWTDDASIYQ